MYTHKSRYLLHVSQIKLYYQVLTGFSKTFGLEVYDYSQADIDLNLHSSSHLDAQKFCFCISSNFLNDFSWKIHVCLYLMYYKMETKPLSRKQNCFFDLQCEIDHTVSI